MSESVHKELGTTDPTLRARVLGLNRWLIPQQHAEIPRLSRRNRVEALVDGQNMMRAMHTDFTSTTAETHLWFTGWDLVETIRLLGGTSAAATNVENVFNAATGRGVDTRILLWIGNAARRHPGSIIPGRGWESFTWARIFVDNKTRGVTGAHHQKTAANTQGENPFGFTGGIDVTFSRWDTKQHRFPDPNGQYDPGNPRIPGHIVPQPWHDVHARVRGPAAGDVDTNFRHRWNDRHANPADQVPVHAAPGATTGTHIVQTLRTFPHHATAGAGLIDWHYGFAPVGEYGYRLAYPLALSNARRLIYIEDQYIVGDEVSAAIEAAMRRSPDLRVILLTAPQPDLFVDAFDFHQNEFVGRLRGVDPARVEIYHIESTTSLGPTRPGIYVHSKICIVDDIWALIGSCNTNRRSLTNDTELGFAVLDETVEHGVRKFTRDFRIELWTEHLGLTPAEVPLIADPVVGAGEWSARAGTPPARIVTHRRPPGADSPFWDTRIDPDGSRP